VLQNRTDDETVNVKDVLINACTKGIIKGTEVAQGNWPTEYLHQYVSAAIEEFCEKPGLEKLRCDRLAHPSS